jgi:hypothetical protein
MKKKLGLVTILVMSLVFVVSTIGYAPVMAEPTNGLKVPAVLIPGPHVVDPPPPPPEREWMTNGGITQVRVAQQVFDPIFLIIGNDPPYKGTSSNVFDIVINLKTRVANFRGNVEFTFDNVVGGFAGRIEMKLFYEQGNPVPYGMSIHTVLQGFGYFEGQTLMLSYDGPGGPWTGYCLKG